MSQSKSIVGTVFPVVVGAAIGVGFAYWLVFAGPDHALPFLTSQPAKQAPAPASTVAKPAAKPAVATPAVASAPKAPETPKPVVEAKVPVAMAPVPEVPKMSEHAQGLPPVKESAQPAMPEPPAPVVSAPVRQPVRQSAVPYGMAAPAPQPVAPAQSACGPLPWQPGPAMEKYQLCQWKQQCLERIANARRMVEQGKANCKQSRGNDQACLQYYESLERRYNASSCEMRQGQMPAQVNPAAVQAPNNRGPI